MASGRNASVELVTLLISRGADVNALDNVPLTFLHTALTSATDSIFAE